MKVRKIVLSVVIVWFLIGITPGAWAAGDFTVDALVQNGHLQLDRNHEATYHDPMHLPVQETARQTGETESELSEESRNESGRETENKAGHDTGNEAGNEAGTRNGTGSGEGTRNETGTKNETGSEEATKNETGNEAENRGNQESGNESGNDSAERTGDESVGEPGAESAADSAKQSEDLTTTESMEKSQTVDLTPNAKSSILMDVDSGTIIYEKNIHEKVPPASITKIMTMLLIMEAIDQKKISLDEMVTASERAASMGGSQIFLEAGEQMTVRDLLKGIALASGNDASVALAEKIAGSEEMFVQMMNERARQLGMKNTNFVNSSGLPAPNHYSTAHDIAIMSRELLKFEEITEFTGKYQDYLRTDTDNPFWLVNTNKLVRFYTGVDGLKTGYTSEAKFCLSATAKRDGMRVIAVVLGEPNTKTRNAETASLFDYAFTQYMSKQIFEPGDVIGTVNINKGSLNKLVLEARHPYSILLKKGEGTEELRHELVMEPNIEAPVASGQELGKIVVYKGDQIIKEFPLTSPQDIPKAGWWTLFKRTAGKVFFLGED